MAGVSAAMIFPGMRRLGPSLPEYADYAGEHWLIAAGTIAARQFEVLKWCELALAMAVVGSLLAEVARGTAGTRLRLACRGTAIGAAAALLIFQSAVVQPRMDRNMRAYWEAARSGDDEQAEASRRLFDADHPLASGLMQARLALLVLGLAATCAQPCARRRAEGVAGD